MAFIWLPERVHRPVEGMRLSCMLLNEKITHETFVSGYVWVLLYKR